MSELVISGLRAGVDRTEILHGVDLRVRSGEVHVVMGPNGSGKSTLSHVLMGRPGYEVLAGSVTLDGVELLGLPTWERARAGLFLALQYPVEVPGVAMLDVLAAALEPTGVGVEAVQAAAQAEAERLGVPERFVTAALNDDASGGEKKRNETLMLGVLRPRFAVLDELDSGLDIDALRTCTRRVADAVRDDGLGVLAITHYDRLLVELVPDVVHVLVGGAIVASGGIELAARLEADGYGAFGAGEEEPSPAAAGDPFADPFADPLAGPRSG